MSDQKQLLKESAAKLRQMALAMEEVDDLTPDEVTCHRELGGRINRVRQELCRLAAELEKKCV